MKGNRYDFNHNYVMKLIFNAVNQDPSEANNILLDLFNLITIEINNNITQTNNNKTFSINYFTNEYKKLNYYLHKRQDFYFLRKKFNIMYAQNIGDVKYLRYSLILKLM